jgi:preprotein translocase subunit SecA
VIYGQRNSVLAAENVAETIQAIREDVVADAISQYIPPQSLPEQWDIPGLEQHLNAELGLKAPVQEWLNADDTLHEEGLRARILEELLKAYAEKEELTGSDALRTFEKQMLLRVLDDLWKEHLATMDHLRQGIHLRGYAQKNPKQEYKREAFNLFEEMLESVKRDTIRILSHVQVRREDPAEEEARMRRQAQEMAQRMQFKHDEVAPVGAADETEEPEGQSTPATAPAAPVTREGPKVGRNDPCPCGSGKKYKQCHGKLD